MKKTLVIAAALFAIPSVGMAQDAPSATVNITDLDLSTKAGQDKLDKRMDQAIRRMCRVDGYDAELRRQETACRLAATADAAPKVAYVIDAARSQRFAAIELDVQG